MTERTPGPPVYIWVTDGEPETGTLQNYAADWTRWRRGLGSRPSTTVLTWDDTTDPISWNVIATPQDRTADGRRRYRIAVLGCCDVVHLTVDEPGMEEGTS